MSYSPKPGYEWHPLRTFPRNEICPCGSGKKFKRCHLSIIPEVLPSDEAAKFRIFRDRILMQRGLIE